ncbi:retrovirus-related pol polyprotein from transposon TNT 1-94 [Tanacetum coccineum]
MTTLADKSLLSGGDNKPPMLEKHLYDSWKSRMELYMMNRPHGRMILASVEKGPLVWPSITEDGVTRLKEYVELTPAEAIQADCDIKAINIILQGLPTEIYALVSQHRVAKDLWEKIKLLMQGTSLTKQERECKLYDEFDKFTYKKGESLHEYYLRFTLLLNDMNIYKMPLEQFLPDEWRKFVTGVKLVKDLHTTNVDQLHAYLQQHERYMQMKTNIASALVGLATNQKFNFSLMIMNGMLGHISNGTPFLMYPRITPLTPPMLEVVTALAAEEEHSTSPHSRAASSARDAQDCVQDTAQRKKFKRLKASTAFKSKQTDAEQRRPTIKKLEVKQVEFKLGEDCWEKQLKEQIKSLRGNVEDSKVKMDMDEIETLNIELEHRVTKLVVENEHLKQTYKQLYYSIKPKRVQSKEQCDALIKQVNIKSGEISDLNAKLQEQGCPNRPLLFGLGCLVDSTWTEIAISAHPISSLGHNRIFLWDKLCDSILEVAFRSTTHAFIRNLEGVDLLTGSRGDNLYTLSLGNMMASSPICLLSKASKTKSWLWHRRLSHLNFGAINHLARHRLVRGLPKLKPMRVASVNGKKYILVIVDDYSRFTWVKCLRSKDEAPVFIINFLKMIQTLREYYEKVGISHETSVARSPQQNGVVERRNRTQIKAARTICTKRIIETIHVDFDELTAMASEHSSSGPALHDMTPVTISSGLVPNPPPSTPFVPPSRSDWDLLFQPMFDESL